MTEPATVVGALDRRLAARLAGGAVELTEPLAAAARRHRTHLLLAASLSPEERATAIGNQLARELTIAAALNAWRDEETRRLLAALSHDGIDVLVMKGSALAHTLYAEPHLRPRLDVDLLLGRDALERAERVVTAEGWTHPVERAAEVAEPQRHYVKDGPGGSLYHLDVHWRIAIPQAFGDALSFHELAQRSVPVPQLGASARTLSPVDALLLACVHRVAHHADAIDLLWLRDIHLLVEHLTAEERVELPARAQRASIVAVTRRGLALAADLFGTPHAAELLSGLAALPPQSESSADFLGGVRPVNALRLDLAALTWSARLALVAEHLFPAPAYMRARYPSVPPVLLPAAYVYRILSGAPRWFKRP